VSQVISLDETDAVFSGHSAFHLDCALYHSVHDTFGDLSLGFIKEEDCWRFSFSGEGDKLDWDRGELTVEVAISNVSDYA
jgi:hypothetical protein